MRPVEYGRTAVEATCCPIETDRPFSFELPAPFSEVKPVTSIASTAMQKADLDSISPDVHGLISKQTAHLDGVDVTRVRFDVGVRWSNDLKGYAGTDLCELPHVALVLSGRLHVLMADGRVRPQRGHAAASRPRRVDGRGRAVCFRGVLEGQRHLRIAGTQPESGAR
jgi:hypothetical protein